jgi:hypothetical protein
MSLHGPAFVADIAGGAALVSAVGIVQQYPFHEIIGTIAGCMAIAYYVYQFLKWLYDCFNNYGDSD